MDELYVGGQAVREARELELAIGESTIRLETGRVGLQANGAVFDSSAQRSGRPFAFLLGNGDVTRGLELGVLEMCIGEERTLRVPPELGFGTKGRPSSPGKPRISGDAILVFTLALDQVPGKDEEILEANGPID